MRAFFFVIALLLVGLAYANESSLMPVDVYGLSKSENPPLILDVRSVEEFDAGHIPGALNIPHDQVASRLAEIEGHTAIILYCRSGRRADLVAPTISQTGADVRLMEGSFIAWQAAGLPIAVSDQATKSESKK